MDIDIVDKLKMLNSFVDPRPRMTIEEAINEIEQLRKNCFSYSDVEKAFKSALNDIWETKL